MVVQCNGTTKQGVQCSKVVKTGRYCHHHIFQGSPPAAPKELPPPRSSSPLFVERHVDRQLLSLLCERASGKANIDDGLAYSSTSGRGNDKPEDGSTRNASGGTYDAEGRTYDANGRNGFLIFSDDGSDVDEPSSRRKASSARAAAAASSRQLPPLSRLQHVKTENLDADADVRDQNDDGAATPPKINRRTHPKTGLKKSTGAPSSSSSAGGDNTTTATDAATKKAKIHEHVSELIERLHQFHLAYHSGSGGDGGSEDSGAVGLFYMTRCGIELLEDLAVRAV